jgi:hypothetical protein
MERVVQSLCGGERQRGVDSRALVVNTSPHTIHETVDTVPVTRAASLLRVGSVWFAPALISLVRQIDTDVLVLQEAWVPDGEDGDVLAIAAARVVAWRADG